MTLEGLGKLDLLVIDDQLATAVELPPSVRHVGPEEAKEGLRATNATRWRRGTAHMEAAVNRCRCFARPTSVV